jgi:hypothetical protein
MDPPLYSVRIGESHCIAEGIPYDALLDRIVEFTIRAAVARSADESEWEHEELRRKGLGALQIFCNRRAVWDDRATFETEIAAARRQHVGEKFEATNELNPALLNDLDRDLQMRWRRAGYEVPSLRREMKPLFAELERDAADRVANARESLLGDVLAAQAQETK